MAKAQPTDKPVTDKGGIRPTFNTCVMKSLNESGIKVDKTTTDKVVDIVFMELAKIREDFRPNFISDRLGRAQARIYS